ncbi:restriction endonuclease [Salmonella enterica subsp. enterica serovar Typhimurium]|nr:restriction endonuclease [Salmonella enterica subsp. enterica]VFS22708.1 restriction endonuclease [Salmonella enterica subsp. enterica serovar Typhimurium]
MGTLKLIQYPSQLLSLTISDIINKQNLSQLIQKSKKDDSENWEGKDWIIKKHTSTRNKLDRRTSQYQSSNNKNKGWFLR